MNILKQDMKVRFLRHAESVFNATGNSDKDCSITEKGKEQASKLKEHFDIIICSTMKRACQTLDNSQMTYGKLIFTDLCREKRVDICDFLDCEDEKDKESDEELKLRIKKFLCFLKSQVSSYQRVLVISHRDFIYEFTNKQFNLDNAEICYVDI